MRTKLFSLVSLLLAASVILAACGQATPVVQTVIVGGEVQVVTATPGPAPEGPKTLTFLGNLAGDIPTIDPALTTDTSSVQIVDETTVGLTRQNEVTTAVEPGIATTWDIVNNDDGTQTVTFHLRNDVPWVKWDGSAVVQVMDCQETPAPRMVNAHDFVYGITRTLAPATASSYAYVLAFAIKGASDYNAGTNEDPASVAVTAVDDWTVEITFLEQATYNVNIAGMWVAHAQPAWIIDGDDCTEANGNRWTETGFFQGYGPYTLREWVHNTEIVLVKNPFWPGSDAIPQAKIELLRGLMLDEIPAFAEYESGGMDVTSVPLADLDRVKADPVLSQELTIGPVLCTYYYGFNTQAPFVDDVRVRLALSEAIDRQALIDNVLKGGQEPAQWFARPGLNGAPTMADHPDLGVKFDPIDAKAQLDAYLAEKGITAADVDITLMFNTSSGHQRIAEAIQQMWKDTLGIEVKLTNQEFAVFLDTIRDPVATPQIYRLGWCQDYPDANNFDREVWTVGGSANLGPSGGGAGWENADYERLVVEAAREQDPVARVDLYAQAEEILVKTDAVMAPIYWYTRVSVTKPYVTRTFSVLGGLEHFEKWDINK